ncbi:MAG: penicillin-binding protein 2 [Brevinematales bacterium]|nr:penicillin-binding protein 2 [Brevinematales bacterium]
MSKRIWILFSVFLVAVAIVAVRLITLMIPTTLTDKTRSKTTGNRGILFDRNKNILAVSYKGFSAWVNPKELSSYEKKYLSELVTKYFNINKDIITERLNKNSNFSWIVRRLSEDKIKKLIALTNEFQEKFNKNSIKIVEEYTRSYPLLEKASTVVGTVNVDNEGISGIEYSFNDILLENNNKSGNITLTIDKYIQEIAYIELSKSVKELEADLGMAIFSKKDGEIIAIVDYPSFDPNNITKIPFTSRGVSYIVEPGSVMKLASMALILEKFPEIEKQKYICNGIVKVYNHTIREQAHGIVQTSSIIAHSCNVGMLQLADKLNENELYFFLRSLGFGEKTMLGLPGEETGILRPFNEWSRLSKYMLSIGQEIGVSAIQLLKLGLIIANDGININPRLIKEVVLPDGSTKDIVTSQGVRIMSSYVANKIRKYSRDSVEYGTSKLAEIKGLYVGGKTGTGQIYNPKGGYYKDQYNAVFLGFAPYNDPKIIGVVILVNPKKLKQGGTSSAPTFRRIVEKIIAYNPLIIQTQ